MNFWQGFASDPVGIAVTAAALILTVTCIAFGFVHTFSVRGTRRRYVAQSVQRTLIIPACVLLGVKAVGYAAGGFWVGVVLDVFLIISFLRDWSRIRNDDDWWTGRWNKLKNAFRTRASVPALSRS
ncbi:hypothetical protein [Arthrobacter sp. IK3]|uniref:hypothetical protein n=1 Tax=Arthrobacter sp. IK3 TaxID=3448169 RepID=UPI003EE3EC61